MADNIASNFPWHIAFADTDAGGVVYHSKYLEIAERARALWLEECGSSNAALWAGGVVFAVRSINVRFRAPARLSDRITVSTTVRAVGGASLDIFQEIHRGDTLLTSLEVELACLTSTGKPRRIPENLLSLLRNAAKPLG
jgi:acyl-CoA thioester hydrolase